MGRKRIYPQVVYVRVFNEGEKLTEEQKKWLLGKREETNDNKRNNIR